MGFEYSTWSFTEAGHGKGVADGIGGATKRALDRQVAFGKDITNGSEAYDILNKCMTSVKCWLIPNSDIENLTKIVPDNLSPIVGTMQIHQVVSYSEGQIQYSLSCFCGVDRGLCECYELKTHIFNKKNEKAWNANRSREVPDPKVCFHEEQIDEEEDCLENLPLVEMDVKILDNSDLSIEPIPLSVENKINKPNDEIEMIDLSDNDNQQKIDEDFEEDFFKNLPLADIDVNITQVYKIK
ncbi:uncharacterized protein LOC132902990 [Amyelois transitella]|uniref:uncharacterized protein LOC132902990 n=1 Tax=Amyelois transitella TaxID=680683 RepID=UPI00299052A8|nr:uncharacterized protein LOC132902990 [Amyelois transitella]